MGGAGTCPDRALLEAFAANQSVFEHASFVEAHLGTCRTCLKFLIDLGGGPLFPRIPNCLILREIGRGRFGVVYKAWWLNERSGATARPHLVALKLLSSAGEMETVRFDREIAVLQKLDSPNIVKCLHSGTSGDGRYYLMDYVEGVHLDEHIATRAQSMIDRLEIFRHVCRAVADAHALGVVHRDLKPKNILVDQEGIPHILDFGICSVAASDWTSWARYTITQPGDVIGTLKYMSPEQAWGGAAAPISERSDVWALGIMLYEIVTGGGYPYSVGSTPDKPAHEALLDRIRKELPRLPRLSGVPRGRDLEILLERCLAWEPRRRLATAAQLGDDLARYCAGVRIQTRPFPIRYRLHRVAVGAAVRAPWIFWPLFLALAAIVLQACSFWLRIGWSIPGHAYRNVSRSAGDREINQSASERIRVAAIQDDTADAILDFARSRRMDGVTQDITSWRAVHGFVMQRLAAARPLAVVWDYYFQSLRPDDDQLLAGIEALERVGVPVILAARTYSAEGDPHLSPEITRTLGRRLRHGAIVARDTTRAPGEFVIAIRRAPDIVIPSVAVVALGAVLHPEAKVDLQWGGRGWPIEVSYERREGDYLRERDRVDCQIVASTQADRAASLEGDLMAFTSVVLDRPEIWEARTFPYQRLLAAHDDELALSVTDRLVVFGDLRTSASGITPDRHPVRYSATVVDNVPGCYLLANAIAGLLDSRYVKTAFPPTPGRFLGFLMIGALGCMIPRPLMGYQAFDRRPIRRAAGFAVVILALCSVWVTTLTKSFWLVHLGMAGFALFFPMAGSLWVEFARNRHRVLDTARDALDQLRPSTDGTLTLALQQEKSPRGIR